jgi:hypothetical protein
MASRRTGGQALFPRFFEAFAVLGRPGKDLIYCRGQAEKYTRKTLVYLPPQKQVSSGSEVVSQLIKGQFENV